MLHDDRRFMDRLQHVTCYMLLIHCNHDAHIVMAKPLAGTKFITIGNVHHKNCATISDNKI